MQVYSTVNVGRKFRKSSWCPLNRGLSTFKYMLRCIISSKGEKQYPLRFTYIRFCSLTCNLEFSGISCFIAVLAIE